MTRPLVDTLKEALIRGVFLSILFQAAPLGAANDDGVLLGNSAALSAGAVSAVVSDGTSVWYNPAGLAAAETNTVDVSASAFVLRFYEAAALLSATTGESSDGSVFELVSIPSALTYVRPIGESFRLGLGVFVPVANELALRSTLEAGRADITSSTLFAVSSNVARYHFGAAAAIAALPSLRLGVSLFGLYQTSVVSSQFSASLTNPLARGVVGAAVLVSSRAFGMEAGAGLQWDPSEKWSFGLSLRSPGLLLVRSTSSISSSLGAVVIPGIAPTIVHTPTEEESFAFDGNLFTPFRARLGVAYRFSGGWLSLEGDLQPGLKSPEIQVDRELTWNLRLGGRVDLTENLVFGAGGFTDRSPTDVQIEGFGDSSINYYGLSAGLEYRSAHHLREDEPEDQIVFSTTLAVRYAFGSGEIGGLRVDPTLQSGANSVQTPAVDVTVHELTAHIGSALYF